MYITLKGELFFRISNIVNIFYHNYAFTSKLKCIHLYGPTLLYKQLLRNVYKSLMFILIENIEARSLKVFIRE